MTADTRHRGLITVCLMLATLMQALDMTIANVALPYMQGSLSASYDEITWVLTSYVVTAAILTAPIGWLAARYGRKALFITCLSGFTVASILCGISGSLVQVVLARLLQGAFGAGLVPLSQSTMLDIYPPEKRGMAMSVWGMGVMLGPILGPTLGGYLTAQFDWRYVFFINVPVGALAVAGLLLFMPRDEPGPAARFDWTGFAALSLGLGALQIALDKGQELDWLGSGVIVLCFLLAALGFYLFVVHMLLADNTFLPRAIFTDRNFVGGLITMGSVGVVLLAASALLSPYLESLSGYPVMSAGMLMAPRGLGTMVAMLVAGRLTARFDPRLLMLCGYGMLAVALYLQQGWVADEPVAPMAAATFIQGFGLGFVFVPLQVVAFYTLPVTLRTQGTALLSLLRNVGSAVGVSVCTALLSRQGQVEHAVLAQYVTPFSRSLQVGGPVSALLNPASPHGAVLLDSLVNTQAQVVAYADDYHFLLFTVIPGAACLLLMRRPAR